VNGVADRAAESRPFLRASQSQKVGRRRLVHPPSRGGVRRVAYHRVGGHACGCPRSRKGSAAQL
jgi:hypothetical protein